ncbi:MAG: SUF system Fe-S cluster assembly regulator [Thermoanaerobaculia bacterium]
MTKQTDYGFVLLSHLAYGADGGANAPDLAAETRLPLPMVSKILKLLVKSGLLDSHRGVKGGYSLARPAEEITASQILQALEGPVALTVCIEGSPGECDREPFCAVRGPWQRINREIFTALDRVTLADLVDPPARRLVQLGHRAAEAAAAASGEPGSR